LGNEIPGELSDFVAAVYVHAHVYVQVQVKSRLT